MNAEPASPITAKHIEWALIFHRSQDAWMTIDHKEYDSPEGRAIKAWMIDNQLIRSDEGAWGEPTERLRVFVEHLCAQPLPVATWVMP